MQGPSQPSPRQARFSSDLVGAGHPSAPHDPPQVLTGGAQQVAQRLINPAPATTTTSMRRSSSHPSLCPSQATNMLPTLPETPDFPRVQPLSQGGDEQGLPHRSMAAATRTSPHGMGLQSMASPRAWDFPPPVGGHGLPRVGVQEAAHHPAHQGSGKEPIAHLKRSWGTERPKQEHWSPDLLRAETAGTASKVDLSTAFLGVQLEDNSAARLSPESAAAGMVGVTSSELGAIERQGLSWMQLQLQRQAQSNQGTTVLPYSLTKSTHASNQEQSPDHLQWSSTSKVSNVASSAGPSQSQLSFSLASNLAESPLDCHPLMQLSSFLPPSPVLRQAGSGRALPPRALENAEAGSEARELEWNPELRARVGRGPLDKADDLLRLSSIFEQGSRLQDASHRTWLPGNFPGTCREGPPAGKSSSSGQYQSAQAQPQSPSVFLQTALKSLASLHHAQEALGALQSTDSAQSTERLRVSRHLLVVEEGLHNLMLMWQSLVQNAVGPVPNWGAGQPPVDTSELLHAYSGRAALASASPLLFQRSLLPQDLLLGGARQRHLSQLFQGNSGTALQETLRALGNGAPRDSIEETVPLLKDGAHGGLETLVMSTQSLRKRSSVSEQLAVLCRAGGSLSQSSVASGLMSSVSLLPKLMEGRGALELLQMRESLLEGEILRQALAPCGLEPACGELCTTRSYWGRFHDTEQTLLERMDLSGSASNTTVWIESESTDVDPGHDGYRWRKCGKKMIKDAMHPRTYFRCAEEGCPAKKTMQRVPGSPAKADDKGAKPGACLTEGADQAGGNKGGRVRTLVTYDNQHDHPKHGESSSLPGPLSSLGGFNNADLVQALSAATRDRTWGVSQSCVGHDSLSADLNSVRRVSRRADCEMQPVLLGAKAAGGPLLGPLPRSEWARALLLGSASRASSTQTGTLPGSSLSGAQEVVEVPSAAIPASSTARSWVAAGTPPATDVPVQAEGERAREALLAAIRGRGEVGGQGASGAAEHGISPADPEGMASMDVEAVSTGPVSMLSSVGGEGAGLDRVRESMGQPGSHVPRTKKARRSQLDEGAPEVSGETERRPVRGANGGVRAEAGTEECPVRLFGFTITPEN